MIVTVAELIDYLDQFDQDTPVTLTWQKPNKSAQSRSKLLLSSSSRGSTSDD